MAWAAERFFLAPPGISSNNSWWSWETIRVWSSPGPASVDQEPQHRELLVVDHWTQPAHPGADQGHGVRIGGVGLAALTGREDPSPGRELGRDVDDFLVSSEESHRDVVADPETAFDRPNPVWELADVTLIAANPSASVAKRPHR